MRCKKVRARRRCPWRLWGIALLFLLAVSALWFSWYVNHEWKPTLYALAEYEARASVTGAMNRAVADALQADPTLCQTIYHLDGDIVQLDAVAANRAKTVLVDAVERALAAIPEQEREIPLGSLTDNSLLGGFGPVWKTSARPEGYVVGTIVEETTVQGINTASQRAVLRLETTVNMILDSYSATITVETTVPLGGVLFGCETPTLYATDVD